MTNDEWVIRLATASDYEAIWRILEPIVRAGEVFAWDRDLAREEAMGMWFAGEVLVAVLDGEIVGSYYIKPNQPGGGSHVANGGYMTSRDATGRGVARTMVLHSLERAREKGFRAMQFNFVVSTNERAVRLWQSVGFEIVGTLPEAFLHPSKGEVDVYVMFRRL